MKCLFQSIILQINSKTSQFVLKNNQFKARSRTYSNMSGLTLLETVQKLNEFADLELAEKWDNVGLLLQPNTPRYKIIFFYKIIIFL